MIVGLRISEKGLSEAMSMSSGEGTDEERPLESWKEISEYLHCSRRTGLRWEAELDLPIHRLDGTPKARVFAFKAELDRWLKEKLNHSDEIRKGRDARRFRLKRLFPASAICFIILSAAALLAPRFFSPPLPPLPKNKLTLAVLPFDNSSGEEALDAWKTALPDLVITDMAQSRIVDVVRITDLYRALVSLRLGEVDRFSDDDLKRISQETRADRVATGAIQKAGHDLILTVSVRDPRTGQKPRQIQADLGGESGMFAAADDLSRKIKRALDLDLRERSRDVDRDVRRVSTVSSKAFALFSRGYRLAGIEKYQEGIALLQQAVEIDPEFALAYKYLWRASINTGRKTDESAYIRKAVEFFPRLSERERGDLTVLFYRNYDKNPAKEKEALERLWRFHPDDRFGGIALMDLYIEREDWGKALAVAESGLAANRKEMIFVRGLVRCFENSGRADKAVKTLNEFVRANPEHPYWLDAVLLRVKCSLLENRFEDALADIETLAARYPGREMSNFSDRITLHIHRGNFAAAEREIHKVLEGNGVPEILKGFLRLEGDMLLRDIRLLQGKVKEASTLLKRAAVFAASGGGDDGSPRPQMTFLHCELAYLHRISGDFAEAMKEVEKAEAALQPKNSTSWNPRWFLEIVKEKAIILLEMNKIDEFHRLVLEVRKTIAAQPFPKLMRVYYYLLGQGEMKKNNPEKAAEYFWKAVDLVSVPGLELEGADPCYFYSMAQAYERVPRRNPILALSMYEKVILPTTNRLHSGDLYARSMYRIAKIYEGRALDSDMSVQEIQTSKSKAIEYYRKFLELWKDADPIFEGEIKDAKQRLAALGSE